MLSIGKLIAGAEDYYLEVVARGAEEYYTGAGEAPGYWLGEGAERFGLDGQVEPQQLRWLLAGRHPITGGTLPIRSSRAPKVGGFDFTYSPPK